MTATNLQPLEWQGPRLRLARAVWITTALLASALLLAAIPGYVRLTGVFTEQEQYAARLVGAPALFSPSPQFEFWNDVVYQLLSFGSAGLSLALAVLIFRRRPNEPIAFATSFILLLYAVVMAGPLEMILGQSLAGQSVAYFAQMLLLPCFIILFFIFPDGRFVPGWTRWFSWLLLPWTLFLAVTQLNTFVIANLAPFFVLYTLPSLAGPYAQFVRYRRVADAVQRQQTKWVILGMTAWILAGTAVTGLLLLLARQFIGPAATVATPESVLIIFAARLLWPLSLTFWPAALTVAILRYRLFDIDLLLNRALVYSTLTGCVIGLYVLVVGGLGALLQSNALWASAILTAVTAAFLLRPLRAQVQRGVDHLTRRAATVQPETGLSQAQPLRASPPAPTAVSPARVGVADKLFRLLVAAGVLAWAALAGNVLAHPSAAGLVGQGLYMRVWLGLFVGPIVLLIGALIIWRLPGNACGRLLILVACAAIAMQFNIEPNAPPGAVLAAEAALLFTAGLVGPGLGYLMLTFPDGRIFPARWAPAVLAAAGVKFAGVLLEILATPGKIRILAPTTNPLFLPALAPYRPLIAPTIGMTGLLLPLITLAGMISMVRRYHGAAALERQQIKWVLWGFGVFAPAAMTAVGLIFSFGPDSPQFRAGFGFVAVAQTLFLASFAVAILRFRLFDIDLLINRTLVYGALSVLVVGVYVLAVGYLSQLFQTTGSFVLSLLATGLIALFFQPLRERLQRAVNRLLYGERDDPYAVLSSLAKRLEAALAPQAVLPTLVETIAQTLKLPYVAVALQPTADGEPQIAASYGLTTPTSLRLPLTYQSERMGELRIAPRGPGESFTPAEQRLLNDIAHQAGAAAHAVRLTADLQRSRERLVTAREEERRRLRRDLHDGLGPALAIESLKVGAARSLLSRTLPVLVNGAMAADDLHHADAVLAELEQDIAATLADIRRLVYDLRPPTLDELGLVAAIRESAARYTSGPASSPQALRVRVEAPGRLPAMPAAVEVAAFRITQEALTNVVRHAQARTCLICLKVDDGLWVEIVDDGVGLPATRTVARTGFGLASLRERAAELGGTCTIDSRPGGGTRVLAHLPLG